MAVFITIDLFIASLTVIIMAVFITIDLFIASPTVIKYNGTKINIHNSRKIRKPCECLFK